MDVGTLDLVDLERWSSRSDAEIFDELMQRGIGDGLPLARPSSTVVDDLVRASGHGADELIGPFKPFPRMPRFYEVAICAALAGCRPQHMKIVTAITEAMKDARLNLLGALTTTGSAAFAIVVNGPIRNASGINSTGNLLGPGAQANAAIGRALAFITRAVCGVTPRAMDMATMGQPGKYTLCFGENEEESPWEPFHASRGMTPTQSAVTLLAVSGTSESYTSHWSTPEDIFQVLAQTLANPATIRLDLTEPVVGGGNPLLLLSPEWAQYLNEAGISKARFKSELFERATCPWSRLAPSVVRALSKMRATSIDQPLRVATSPDDILVMVAGGVGIKQTVLPNWAGSQAVTVLVE